MYEKQLVSRKRVYISPFLTTPLFDTPLYKVFTMVVYAVPHMHVKDYNLDSVRLGKMG